MLVCRFYTVMGQLCTELTYIPDFNPEVSAHDRLPVFLGRVYSGSDLLGSEGLTEALYQALSQAEECGYYRSITDWLV